MHSAEIDNDKFIEKSTSAFMRKLSFTYKLNSL